MTDAVIEEEYHGNRPTFAWFILYTALLFWTSRLYLMFLFHCIAIITTLFIEIDFLCLIFKCKHFIQEITKTHTKWITKGSCGSAIGTLLCSLLYNKKYYLSISVYSLIITFKIKQFLTCGNIWAFKYIDKANTWLIIA